MTSLFSRRQALAMLSSSIALAACGGGGGRSNPNPSPTNPPPPPPPPPLVPAVIVQESAAADLESTQALALLDDLHAKLDKDTDLRLSISWRLERPGSSE